MRFSGFVTVGGVHGPTQPSLRRNDICLCDRSCLMKPTNRFAVDIERIKEVPLAEFVAIGRRHIGKTSEVTFESTRQKNNRSIAKGYFYERAPNSPVQT